MAKKSLFRSGWGGIRTPGTVTRTAVFKTAALVHSATHPARHPFEGAREIRLYRPIRLPVKPGDGSNPAARRQTPEVAAFNKDKIFETGTVVNGLRPWINLGNRPNQVFFIAEKTCRVSLTLSLRKATNP